MEFGHHLEWDVRPSLLSPLFLRAGENRRETFTFHWTPLHGNFGQLLDHTDPTLPQGELVIFDVRTDWTWLWSAEHPLAMEQTAEATPFGYVRRQVAPWGEARDYYGQNWIWFGLALWAGVATPS